MSTIGKWGIFGTPESQCPFFIEESLLPLYFFLIATSIYLIDKYFLLQNSQAPSTDYLSTVETVATLVSQYRDSASVNQTAVDATHKRIAMEAVLQAIIADACDWVR